MLPDRPLPIPHHHHRSPPPRFTTTGGPPPAASSIAVVKLHLMAACFTTSRLIHRSISLLRPSSPDGLLHHRRRHPSIDRLIHLRRQASLQAASHLRRRHHLRSTSAVATTSHRSLGWI
ncbi:hypothetical protein E3N88_07490 [Mikania micrantha]|uniref:Uncharacterized protein n=1 Tax=Mikania micrantha TaxID=192012 RepID=A0A5N6PRP4_9ASTR|nr:hypothetical protein E3N88_07490 [Mikania micrantha]